MFTGIVEEVGRLKLARPGKLSVIASVVAEGIKMGDSISINGACLTVTELSDNSFCVDVMPETLRRTNLGMLHPGDSVNLERALSVSGGRLGGHMVQGHVDAMGKILSVAPEENAFLVRIAAPTNVMCYVVDRGFIAVDGVSLTVISHDAASFVISLVGYTRQHTTLGSKRIGNVVNLEADIIAKYVEHLKEKDSPGITLNFLAEQGFLT
jgi:riboflavin synthase